MANRIVKEDVSHLVPGAGQQDGTAILTIKCIRWRVILTLCG